jgi:hypothetical protein
MCIPNTCVTAHIEGDVRPSKKKPNLLGNLGMWVVHYNEDLRERKFVDGANIYIGVFYEIPLLRRMCV